MHRPPYLCVTRAAGHLAQSLATHSMVDLVKPRFARFPEPHASLQLRAFRIPFSANRYSFRDGNCWSTVLVMYIRMRTHSISSPSPPNPQPAPDKSVGSLMTGRTAARLEGASIGCGLLRATAGTSRFNAENHEARVPMWGTGADRSVGSMKPV
jgi:hypothetical protein